MQLCQVKIMQFPQVYNFQKTNYIDSKSPISHNSEIGLLIHIS